MTAKQTLLLIIRICCDLLMVGMAWAIAYYIRFYTNITVTKGIPNPVLYAKLLPFIGVIWFAVLASLGFYRRTGNHRSAFTEALDIVQVCVLATLSFIAFSYFYEEYRYSRITLVIFAALHPVMIIFGRSVIRKSLRKYRKNRPARSILFIGGGESLIRSFSLFKGSEIESSQIYGAMLVGDEEINQSVQTYLKEQQINEMDLPTDWPQFFMDHSIQSVMFALPHKAYGFLDLHLDEIANQISDVKFMPDLLRYTRFSAGIEMIRGVPVISIHESPLIGVGSLLKRVVDIFGALVALCLFGPLMLLIASIVAITSTGPIFYRQSRMGLDGKTFDMLKFRSMPTSAEKKTGAIWANKSDDRATPIGRLIRSSSLDELPQLFNVIRGDMSLVGPRPERPVFVNEFRRQIPGYMLRHKVKAGMTGWAQVNGWRGDTSIEKRIECDLYYIQNWSIWLDLRIILLTFLKGFFSKNAY